MAHDDAVRNAILTNTPMKVVFGGLTPDEAELLTRQLFQSSINLEEWKPHSARPVAVGQDKVHIQSASQGSQTATQKSWAEARVRGQGLGRSVTHGHARGTMRGETVGSAEATGWGTSSGSAVGSADTSAQMDSTSQAWLPALGILDRAQLVGQGVGSAISRGSSSLASTSSASMRSGSKATSRAKTLAHSDVESDAVAESQSSATSIGHTAGHGVSSGTSESAGTSEAFITRYEWLPSSMYTLAEQMARLMGKLMDQPNRFCCVKVEGARPYVMRTPEVSPPFRSHAFRAVVLPLFVQRCIARSPYLVPVEVVDAELDACFARLGELVEPDADVSAREPLPVVDDPSEFARGFWQRLKAKDAQPSRGSRPRLAVDNDDAATKET